MDATKARSAFSETLDRVLHKGDRIVLRRNGKDVAALVSLDDLRFIEAVEDRLDIEGAAKALSETGDSLAWEKVKADLGL